MKSRIKTPLITFCGRKTDFSLLHTTMSGCSFIQKLSSIHSVKNTFKIGNYPWMFFRTRGLSNALRSLPLLYWICMFCICGFTVLWLVVGLDSCLYSRNLFPFLRRPFYSKNLNSFEFIFVSLSLRFVEGETGKGDVDALICVLQLGF